jgi:hypothetical protein
LVNRRAGHHCNPWGSGFAAPTNVTEQSIADFFTSCLCRGGISLVCNGCRRHRQPGGDQRRGFHPPLTNTRDLPERHARSAHRNPTNASVYGRSYQLTDENTRYFHIAVTYPHTHAAAVPDAHPNPHTHAAAGVHPHPYPEADTHAASAVSLPNISLTAPANGAVFLGRDAAITLQWQSVKPSLQPDEYYLVILAFPHNSATWYDYQWTKNTSIVLPKYLFDNVTGDRIFRWTVGLIRLQAGEPTGDPTGRITILSNANDIWQFQWAGGGDAGGGGGPRPLPGPPGRNLPTGGVP